jgi:hypothetical protein
LLIATSVCVFSVLVIGFNPYVTNFINYGNPLYPTLGDSEYNIQYVMQNQMPSNFIPLSGIEKTFLSIFSPSQNTYGSDSGPIKFPLSITKSELKAFGIPDTRVAGWGPLFGASLIITIFMIIILFLRKSHFRYWWLLITGVILITLMINPESWWARYSPQLWLIPVITLIFFWLTIKLPIMEKSLSYILITLLLLNILMIAGANLYKNINISSYLVNELEIIKNTEQQIYIFDSPLNSIETTLNDKEIPFVVVADPSKLISPRTLLPGVEYSFSISETP